MFSGSDLKKHLVLYIHSALDAKLVGWLAQLCLQMFFGRTLLQGATHGLSHAAMSSVWLSMAGSPHPKKRHDFWAAQVISSNLNFQKNKFSKKKFTLFSTSIFFTSALLPFLDAPCHFENLQILLSLKFSFSPQFLFFLFWLLLFFFSFLDVYTQLWVKQGATQCYHAFQFLS